MKDPIRVTTATRIWRDFCRKLSRIEWAVWLLGLSRSPDKPTEPGLILIQIDGLSKTQLERALSAKRMPFLNSLLEREHYQNHSFYSGIPSSTPSVHGELYYGKRTIVPAFGFRDHRTGRLVRMFANDIAGEIEESLSESGEGLLTGGSSYCNIFSGGAEEVHFCATSFGWSEFLKTVNPFKLLLVLLMNFWMFARVASLMILEFFLASYDSLTGIASGRSFWQELIMIPARVLVVVLLRELVTVGAGYDSARGLPIIHLNLLGYDEQAHRRGPESKFAHWTLTGIDIAIRRIWKAAHRGAGREYDIWVFSDHGQEITKPYQLVHERLVQQVVADLVDDSCEQQLEKKKVSRLPSRANWLGIGWLVSMLFGEQDHDIQSRSTNVQTVTSGPLGFVYFLNDELRKQIPDFMHRLVDEANIPMVMCAMEENRAEVVTPTGKFMLPRDAVQVFGADHPFLDDVSEDMVRLAHHQDSGDIVLIGWTHQDTSTSFVLQNGAHAGPGIDETGGFALLPPDLSISQSGKRYIRPDDLRRAANNFLGRSTAPAYRAVSSSEKQDSIRVLSYNVHACVGMDGQLSPERIARVVAQSDADIICLQELDVFRKRSGNRDQAHAIAQYLEMNYQFHPAWFLEEEQFGNAILTRYPMRVVEAKGLHHHKADRSRRSALWAEVQLNSENSIQVINTHMSIYPREQLIQAEQLIEEWVQPASLLGPVILCGDFNARPRSATHQVFNRTMSDVESFDDKATKSTYFSPYPMTRVDHIFVTHQLESKGVQVISTRIAKVASDHLPLMTDLKILDWQPIDLREYALQHQTDKVSEASGDSSNC